MFFVIFVIFEFKDIDFVTYFQLTFVNFVNMNKNEVFCIGLMSGTSLDGIDLVYVKFYKNEYQNFKIIYTKTLSYTNKWKTTLQKAIHFSEDKLKDLDTKYGVFLGEKINTFINDFSIDKIDFIASHGHTILHEPAKGVTLQIGSGKEIARITNQKVICDFRTQDVKLGGQGAPLVPIGDELLFAEYDYCLNLGGFANISYKKDNERIAFDICPVNIVLNHYANKIGLPYDESGCVAQKGVVNQELLEELNSLEFYSLNAPKSLGLEWVQKEIFPLIDAFEMEVSDILRTFVQHVACQISKVISNSNSVLITGGGAFNCFLIKQIEELSGNKIRLPNNRIINFKEALIFAFLGVLKVDNQVNCLSSVTGAIKDHSSGVIFYPKEF